MIYSFTGTRKGMTQAQKGKIVSFLIATRGHEDVVHHGGCHGADTDFHRYAYSLDFSIVVHPGDAEQAKKYSGTTLWVCLPVGPYRTRNYTMVDVGDVLLACPGMNVEENRSGTWMTIRYAKKQGKPIIIFWPDGRVEEINMGDEG